MNSLAFASADEIKQEQNRLLKKQLAYVMKQSPFYQRLFAGINLDEVHAIDDLKKLPCTTKQDLANFNDDFFAVEKNKIIDYCTTSGTTGNPVTIGLTESDLERLALNEKITFETTLNSNDVVQLMLTLDKQFMAGMAYYIGLRKIGCGIVRSGPGSPKFQIESIQRHGVTALVAVPSFLIKVIQYAKANAIDLNSLSVKNVFCIGEPIREEANDGSLQPNILARKITESWNVKLFGTYASTEMQTAFSECNYGNGGHLASELLIAEWLDDDGNEVTEGETGELTVTHLGVEGLPLVRYRTGDLCKKYTAPCACGKNSVRISSILGRKNQMIKLNGTTVYPNAIIHVLKEFDLDDFLILVSQSDLQTDEVKLLVASSKAVNFETLIQSLHAKVKVKPTIIHATQSEINSYRNSEDRKPKQVVFTN